MLLLKFQTETKQNTAESCPRETKFVGRGAAFCLLRWKDYAVSRPFLIYYIPYYVVYFSQIDVSLNVISAEISG